MTVPVSVDHPKACLTDMELHGDFRRFLVLGANRIDDMRVLADHLRRALAWPGARQAERKPHETQHRRAQVAQHSRKELVARCSGDARMKSEIRSLGGGSGA